MANVRKACHKDGYIPSKLLLEHALKEAARAEFTDKMQFAFILLRTLDKRKQNRLDADFQGMRSLYDEHIGLLLGWARQSAPYLHVDSRDQNLVQLVVHIVSHHPPTKSSTQEHVATTLRDLQNQAKNVRSEGAAPKERGTADGSDELHEILTHVTFRRKETKNFSMYFAVYRANGGTICQKKSQLECAQAILKRSHTDGFNWRHLLVLNFDKADDDAQT
ncbi:hypothetical protein DYB28_005926 [Aphanomyces astaci]|uniref:Uncharacterized protein n=1 Tax=Aphanomyces astaci TaxID=112090 RepID=A0A397AIA5_APHAT|nr:hypothetical protein DYB36_001611 [Aphanomyces astaci]RLN86329.1 hypothetical protein DYB28_005926 [Aphanomyces astaci]RQM19861.1 hypothetical protein B5M09_000632 [Aphanomyces astaci]